jgi:glucokinase
MTALPGAIGAVDIGGTKIAVGLVSRQGELLVHRQFPTQAERGFDDGLARIVAHLRRLSASYTLEGIGVGCTGPVDPFSGRIGVVEFLTAWEGADLVGGLTRAFDLPVALENDADAAALAESAWGVGRGASRFIYVTISTGIGVGLIFDGCLYRGVDGAHPEIGHHVIDPSGPACGCGAHGCWESLASGSALARLSPTPGWDARQVCAAAAAGEPSARWAVARVGYYLGVGLANLVTLFIPDVIALGGGLMNSRGLFWEHIEATVRSQCGYVPYQKTRLLPAVLGPQVGLIGAACTWLQRDKYEETA